MKASVWLYIMLFPVVMHMLIFRYGPLYGILIAFKDYIIGDGIWGSKWVGFKHFERLFRSPDFKLILTNSVMLNVYLVAFTFPIPIILALLLNEVRVTQFKRPVQTLMYLPHFVSWVILGGILIEMLSPSTGVVNILLSFIGIEPIYFMADTFWWRVMFVISAIWKESGWGTIIYLAAIAGVNMDLYEAARIDGANRLQQALHITLPAIMPTVSLLFIMRMSSLMDIGFEHVYMMSNTYVRRVSDVFSTYIYRMGIEKMQFSYTTAIGLFQTTVNFMLLVITNNISRRLGGSTML
jgi:putative aldouronate transport system permease protein